jgi:hypothetical protein
VSLAEFTAGVWRGILARLEVPITLELVPSAIVSRVNAAAATFYGNNTATIEGARGVPGLRMRVGTERVPVPIAYQVGVEMGTLVQRQRATSKAADWGVQLANRMPTAARNQKRLRAQRAADGTVTVTEIDG